MVRSKHVSAVRSAGRHHPSALGRSRGRISGRWSPTLSPGRWHRRLSIPLLLGGALGVSLVFSPPAEAEVVPAALPSDAPPGVDAPAPEEDPRVIGEITELNKKALDAYERLEFEEARALLKEALDLCSTAGLEAHPIKARTHIHMGVVLVAGFKQTDLAVKQFQKALEIQPEIRVTKALANPDILAVFDQAVKTKPAPTQASEQAAPSPGEAEGAATPLAHTPVTRGKRGEAVTITVTVPAELTGYEKVVLAYRPEGEEDFLAADMEKAGSNTYRGQIPPSATDGNLVAYFIEAEASDESVVGAAGSEARPFSISLTGRADRDEGWSEGEAAARVFAAFSLGGGIGYASGEGEVNTGTRAPSGFASSGLVQFVPEAGYYVSPSLRISIQLRHQYITGTTPINAKLMGQPTACGDGICQGAKSATAVFVRASWFLSSGGFRPYVSVAAGAGQLRHVVKYQRPAMPVCGEMGNEACVDTVASGPVFAGPGVGVFMPLADRVGLTLELNTLLGVPKFTFHMDLNAGVMARF